MSPITFILFMIGLLVITVVTTAIARRLTAGDVFNEVDEEVETDREAILHVKRRLARHRNWWMSGMVALALSVYVNMFAMGYIQNLDSQQEADRQRARCDFRSFLVTFFDELSDSQLSMEDLAQLESFQELDPGTQLFVIDLAEAVNKERITIDEAREAYIAAFPSDGCEGQPAD